MVYAATFGGHEGQMSLSHETENRFGGLAEASLWTTFGRVDFLVSISLHLFTHKFAKQKK